MPYITIAVPTLLVTSQVPTRRGLVPYHFLSIQNRSFKISIYSNLYQSSYMPHFITNQQLNSSLDKSNLLFLIDAAILIFKGLQIYLLSLGFHIVYKLVEILIITLYTILELLRVTILYNIQILDLILQKGLQLQLYNNLIFIKLTKCDLVQ